MMILLTVGLIKKDIVETSEYFSEPKSPEEQLIVQQKRI